MSDGAQTEINGELEVKMTMSVVNIQSGKGYTVSSQCPAKLGAPRDETAYYLLDDILNSPMTKAMREVEGWPV